jgi:hypothetical protein
VEEAELLVQRDARLVGERDRSDRGGIALPLEQFEQGGEERPSDAAALGLRSEVDAGFDRPAVSGSSAERRARRIAEQPPVFLGDEPRMIARPLTRDPPRHFICARRGLLEADPAVFGVRTIDAGNRRCIIGDREPD